MHENERSGFMDPLTMPIVIGCAILFIIVMVTLYKEMEESNRRFRECTFVVQAQIITIKKVERERPRDKGHTIYYYTYEPVVQFVYNGQLYLKEIETYTENPYAFMKGQYVNLHINPNNPEEYNFRWSFNPNNKKFQNDFYNDLF